MKTNNIGISINSEGSNCIAGYENDGFMKNKPSSYFKKEIELNKG